MSDSGLVARRAAILLLIVFAFAWFAALAPRQLAKTDEGRYGEIFARDGGQRGLADTAPERSALYFEKPALQYWATAAAFEAFGLNAWATRLYTGLCGFLGVLLVAFTATRLYGRQTGLYAGAILASSALYVMMGHIDTLDMGLTLFMNAGLCAFLLARHAVTPRSARGWMLACWAMLALAVLSKGLVGIVLPGAIVVLYLGFTRDWEALRRVEPVRGMLLFLVISAPWFVAVSLENPGFADFFFIHEHFQRFLTKSAHREGPWWYFVPILALGILPWLSSLGSAIWRAGRQRPDAIDGQPNHFNPDWLLLIWVAFIFVFFSVSGSKLPSYILPILPALAILLARHWTWMDRSGVVLHASGMAVVALAAIVLGLNMGRFAGPSDAVETYQHFGWWVAAAGIVWLAGTALAMGLARVGQIQTAVLSLAIGACAAALIGLCGYSALNRSASAAYVAQAIAPYLDATTPVYSIQMYEQTLPFYLQRTVILVHHRDELDFGLKQEPEKWVPDLPEFARRWAQEPRAVAIMPAKTYDQLAPFHLDERVILSDQRFIVIAKP